MDNPRILIIDDHVDTARLLSRLLERLGHHTTVANGFGAAIEAARATRFDLVLSDIELGDGDGCELLGQIRVLYPIVGIVFSGYGLPEDVRRCLKAGYSAHVLKPTTIANLDQIIRQTLAQHSRAADKPVPAIAPALNGAGSEVEAH